MKTEWTEHWGGSDLIHGVAPHAPPNVPEKKVRIRSSNVKVKKVQSSNSVSVPVKKEDPYIRKYCCWNECIVHLYSVCFPQNNIQIYIVSVWKGDRVKWKQKIHSCLPFKNFSGYQYWISRIFRREKGSFLESVWRFLEVNGDTIGVPHRWTLNPSPRSIVSKVILLVKEEYEKNDT